MGTKMTVSFANIFMAEIETSNTKPKLWKRYVDDIFSLWDSNIQEVNQFIDQADRLYPTIKFTAEVSENKINFLDTVVFKLKRKGLKANQSLTHTLQTD